METDLTGRMNGLFGRDRWVNRDILKKAFFDLKRRLSRATLRAGTRLQKNFISLTNQLMLLQIIKIDLMKLKTISGISSAPIGVNLRLI
jgi:hypothetical protein